jgi:hypothetical protein
MGSGRDRDSALLLEGGQQVGFYSKIEESGWLRHLRLLLITSTVAAERMHFENSSVLIHCSDGWYVRAHSCVCVCVFLKSIVPLSVLGLLLSFSKINTICCLRQNS